MITFVYYFVMFCMFVIGSLFGSFFSLATYRLPRKQDILATRSYCTSCKHRLNFFDLIPVLSYLIRGAKCKYCGEKISPRYFLLEVGNGAVFVLLYVLFGYTLTTLVIGLVYAFIFVAIGSWIMKKKMTAEELKEIQQIAEQKKISKKAGVFLSELVVAFLLFVLLMVTSFVMGRNYTLKTKQNIAHANANFVAVKHLELCLATKYDALNSYEFSETMGGISYKVTTDVFKIADQDFSKKDMVKSIEVKVSYMLAGEEQEFSYKTLKGRGDTNE